MAMIAVDESAVMIQIFSGVYIQCVQFVSPFSWYIFVCAGRELFVPCSISASNSLFGAVHSLSLRFLPEKDTSQNKE